jgi:hypothetical protein
MFIQPTNKHMNGLVWAALGLIFVSIFLSPLAFAGIALNTIDPVAIVADNGHHVIVTGPIACTQGEQAFLRVTVTQRTTGALAEGHTRIICTGDTQQWEVHGSSQRQETFQEAIATAVAVARTTLYGETTEYGEITEYGETTDAHQWLVDITLIGE